MAARGPGSRPLASRLLLWANIAAANVAAVVCVVEFVAPGTLGLGMPFGPGGKAMLLDLATTTAWVVFLVALSLLLWELLWLMRRGGRAEEPARFVLSDAQGDSVRISCDALEAGLRSAGEALAEITRVRVHVAPRAAGKRVQIQAWFNCPEGLPNLDASRLLRRAMEERFNSMVRLPDGTRAEYEIEFLGFAGKLVRKPDDPPPAEPEPETPPPFTGPQYPIGDDES